MDPSKLTPEQLAHLPAAQPPPGVVPNLVNPHSDGNVLLIVGSILVAIMLSFAGLRFYVKAFVRREFKADDWTTLGAVIGTLGYFAICIYAVSVAKFGTHMWDLSALHASSTEFLVSSFLANWPTAIIWAVAKTTFFLMYLQIFSPFRWLRICVYIGLFVTWGFYIAVLIPSIYYMAPNPGQSWQEGFTNPRYLKSLNLNMPIAIGSLILDVYIFLLPLVAVPKLRLSPRKKVGVAAVFATGFIACIASSLTIYFKHKLEEHQNDYTYWVMPVLLMALVEMCVGISCACMPSAAGFFRSKAGDGSKLWSTNAFSMLRSLLRSRQSSAGRSNKSGPSFDKSWNSKVSAGGHPYADIEMGDTSTEELRPPPTVNGKEIHVRRDYYVQKE